MRITPTASSTWDDSAPRKALAAGPPAARRGPVGRDLTDLSRRADAARHVPSKVTRLPSRENGCTCPRAL